MNEYSLNWPKYGDLWVKKVDDDVVLVPPQNMIFKQDADDYKKVTLIEKHEYTKEELDQEIKERGWDSVELKGGEEKIEVYEVYVPSYEKNEKENYYIVIPEGKEILFYAKKTTCPYKKLAWEKLSGRLAGRGQTEKLFEEQIYLNRIANYKAQGLHWTSKHIYQTRDTSLASNLMTEVEDGDILMVNSELNPVAVEERNLAIYRQDELRWEESADKRAFTREPITGGRAPAGTPLGSTILQTRMAMSYFEQKKQDLAMFIKEILWDWVLPEFKNQKRKEHKMLIKNLIEGEDDEDSNKFFKLKLNERMNQLKARSRKYLSPDQWRIRRGIQAEILKDSDMTIPKGLYDNLKNKVDIIIVGEQIDVGAKTGFLQSIAVMLAQNPTMFQDKRVRKIFYKIFDLMGFNPQDLQMTEEPTGLSEIVGQERAQRGGSVAAPPTMSAPTTLPQETRV